jgi:SNF2 family DNA or RNA helicase
MRQCGLGAILADDMGLGKSIQTLALLLHLKESLGGLPGPALLICPTSVAANWQHEIARFTPALTVYLHQGSGRQRDASFADSATVSDIVLTSYAVARRDAELLASVHWSVVALDEAQAIKNPNTRQAQVIRTLPAAFRLALTGTPVENRLTELWSIMHFLNPGYLGSLSRFSQRFATPIERYGDEEATRRLRRLTRPFILRRLKSDPKVIQELPAKQEMKVYCYLSAEQASLYEAVVQKAMAEIEASDGIQRRGQVLSLIMALKQVCNHPAHYLRQPATGAGGDGGEKRSGKLARLAEMLEELAAEGERCLIFTQFAEMGHLLRAFCQERLVMPALYLHGGTPASKRSELVERFQAENGPSIFILSLKAGGLGLNLTRANHVFHFDRWWNPAVEDQATDRAFRIGQQRNVFVHKFVCSGTIEERIDEMIESKKGLADRIVGQGEAWLTELSTAELREMVTLRRELVE